MSKIENLLVERYRPRTVDEYVFSGDHNRFVINKWLKRKEIPHVLLTGGPGTGKTTLAYILCNEMGVQPADVKRINASMMGVATITDELLPWMKKSSMGSPFKIVFLDEADRISDAGQKMLRNVIEDYSDGVRFIATANYPNKISPALHSRFQQLEVSQMDMDDVIGRVIDIMEAEGLQFKDEMDVMSHIEHFYPDMRKILNSIDQHTDDDKNVHTLSISADAQDADAWEELWKGASEQFSLDRAVQLTSTVDQSNFEQFYEVMYQNHKQFPNDVNALILLSQYLDRAQTSANQQLHLHAFLYHAFIVDAE